MKKKPDLLPALTGLRFLLALWVIACHVTGYGGMVEASAFHADVYTFIRGGYLAVTTFFVLSGFVLARSYGETEWSGRALLRYFASRVARIYPVYLLSLVVVAPLMLKSQIPGKGPIVAGYALLLQGWLGPEKAGWNTPAWTLSCEMFFYFTFPLLLILIVRAGWLRTLAIAAAAFWLTRALRACGVPDAIKPIIHLSDFLMGLAAARVFDLIRRGSDRSFGAWLYLPAVAVALALIVRPNWLPSWLDLNTALRPLNALLLIGLALGGGAAARALSTRVAVYLGQASYAMYILHVPILWYWRWSGPVYLSTVIAGSALVYRLLEEPANRWLRRRVQIALQP